MSLTGTPGGAPIAGLPLAGMGDVSTADLAATEGADIAAFSAATVVSGDLDATEGADTAAFDATLVPISFMALAVTEPPDIVAANIDFASVTERGNTRTRGSGNWRNIVIRNDPDYVVDSELVPEYKFTRRLFEGRYKTRGAYADDEDTVVVPPDVSYVPSYYYLGF